MHFTMAELWHEMGPLAKGVMLLLAMMSLLSLAIATEKWLMLKRAARESAGFLRAWHETLSTQGYAAAAGVAERYPQSPIAQIIAAGTRVLTAAKGAPLPLEAYDRTVRRLILATGATVKKGLGSLATVGSTAPFVGLFGTVIGIVNAFQQMAVSGQGGLGVVAAGIAEALVATALGIGVALPAVWLFNYLTQQIAQLLTEMECAAEELIVAALGTEQPVTRASSIAVHEGDNHGNAAWRE